MTASEWLRIAEFVVMGTVSVVVFVLGRERAAVEERFRALGSRLNSVEARLDRSGQKMSDLTDLIHGLPERMRGIFASNERLNDLYRESQLDRERLHDEIKRLEDK